MNRKGFVGELLVFTFTVGVIAIYLFMTYVMETSSLGALGDVDIDSSVTVIFDEIINTHHGLLYTETEKINGEDIIFLRRNVIDWNKAEEWDRQFIKPISKGPYQIMVEVKNIDTDEKITTKNGCILSSSADKDRLVKKATGVLIKDGNKLYRGVVEVTIASSDFSVEFKEDGAGKYAITATNLGACDMGYGWNMTANCDGEEWYTLGVIPVETNPSEGSVQSIVLDAGESSTFTLSADTCMGSSRSPRYQCPPCKPDKIVIWPSSLEDYKKVAVLNGDVQ